MSLDGVVPFYPYSTTVQYGSIARKCVLNIKKVLEAVTTVILDRSTICEYVDVSTFCPLSTASIRLCLYDV